MPSLSAYTAFESLLFIQSLASFDTRPDNFSSISELLRNNPFVRQDATFDSNRLTPQALEELYATLVKGGFEFVDIKTPDQFQERHGSESPTKRRKVTHSSVRDGRSHSTIIPDLVSRLYARYKELITSEIRDEERRYTVIKDEIGRLQGGGVAQTLPAEIPGVGQQELLGKFQQSQPTSLSHGVESRDAQSDSHMPRAALSAEQIPKVETDATQKAGQINTQKGRSSTVGIQPDANLHAGVSTNLNVPGSNQSGFSQQHPKDVPQTASSWLDNAPKQQAETVQHPETTIKPSTPPTTGPATKAVSTDRKIAPLATSFPTPQVPGQISTQQMAQGVTAAHAWPAPSASQPLASPHPNGTHLNGQSATNSFPVLQQANIKEGTFQSPYPLSVPHTTNQNGPIHPLAPPMGAAPEPGNIPPKIAPRPIDHQRLSTHIFRSNTPWKTLDPLVIPRRLGSPEPPPPGNISPISERAPSPAYETGRRPGRPRKTRQELASLDTKGPTAERDSIATGRGSRKSTPTLRKRQPQSPLSPSRVPPNSKRRRDRSTMSRDGEIKQEFPSTPVGLSAGVENLEGEASRTKTPSGYAISSRHVTCTRNFSRICAPIMNDVAAHKHASIFAKPLTERDAPGYKDFIYRPQDIKSIKSAIHQGSKAVAAAYEALNTPNQEAESSGTGAATPSKNNGLILKKTTELAPPKSIVNSSQLEKELVRMFANAVMFNPTSEQTFGPAFPMQGGLSSRATSPPTEPEEGGIVRDTMEMYEDVERAVSSWRAAERTVDDLGSKSAVGLRRGSVSDANIEGADDAK